MNKQKFILHHYGNIFISKADFTSNLDSLIQSECQKRDELIQAQNELIKWLPQLSDSKKANELRDKIATLKAEIK